MTSDTEPPVGHQRAGGSLLAAVAAEAWLPDGFGPCGPVATALIDLARAYVANAGEGPPVEVAERHQGQAASALLLPVAIVRPFSSSLAADALQLARASGVPGHALSPCVAYVELAAELFSGRTPDEAVRAVTREPMPRRSTAPALCGELHLDALSAGIWALAQPYGVEEVVPALGPLARPAIRAAAAALVGLRDGANAMPDGWRTDVPEGEACLSLGGELVGVRHRAYLHRSPRATTSGEHPVTAPEPPPAEPDSTERASFWSWSLRR